MSDTELRVQWVAEMAELLRAGGYNAEDAGRLYDEGMGPEEVAGRLKEPDGLTRTHGLVKQ